jgi:hypothetical protein
MPIVFPESDMASEDLNVSKTVKPEVVNNLKSIEIINMNGEDNSKINLKLPKDWYATKYIYDIVPEFQFNAEKNKKIKKTYNFNIYNGKDMNKFNLYGTKGVAGTFEMLGYYRDQSESTHGFPNHSQLKSKVFSGKTALGQGEIFILDCDLVKELRTEKYTTYDVVYALIPIENENLAYNLAVSVPLGEKDDNYIQMVKRILEAI